MYDYTLNHNGTEVPFGFAEADYKTDVITRPGHRLRATSAASPQPFYLQVWYTAPHVEEGTDSTGRTFTGDAPARPTGTRPLQHCSVPAQSEQLQRSGRVGQAVVGPGLAHGWNSRTASMAAKYRTQWRRSCSVDEGVRQAVDAVSAAGELDNTLLIFASDNGNMHGEHRIPFGKGDVYEQSIKVPLAVAGPGFPAGRVSAPQ